MEVLVNTNYMYMYAKILRIIQRYRPLIEVPIQISADSPESPTEAKKPVAASESFSD